MAPRPGRGPALPGTFLPRATLIPVKSIRVWLLVLLAFALPMRGGMAAAMVCLPAAAHSHAVPGAHGHEHAGHGDAAARTPAAHDHGGPAGHDATGKCSSCASCCSVSIPVVATFTLAQAPPAAARFPELPAPAAEFFSGGQERPPRTT